MAKPASGISGNLRNQAFFKLHRGEGFVEAAGNRFEYQGVMLFVHKEGDSWGVTEGASGLSIAQLSCTMREAMQSARETIDRIGTERLHENLADSIDRHGSAMLGIQANSIHAQRQANHREMMARMEQEQAQRQARNLARQQARYDRKMAQIRQFQAKHGVSSVSSTRDDDDLPF